MARGVTLDAVRTLALALPEATEAPHFAYTSFRVRGKIFATAPPAGDALNVFVDDAQRDAALALHPDCIETLFWGQRVAGVRVLLAKASTAIVRDLLLQSWRRKAPKALMKS